MLHHKKKQKWSYLFDNLQKDFIYDLEKSFNRITHKALEKCESNTNTSEQLTCIKEIDDKMKDLLQKFQKDLTQSLNNLEICVENSDKTNDHINCILKFRREVQKEGLLLLDTSKLRIN